MATMLRTVVVLLVLLVLTTPAGAEDGSSGLSLEPRETEQLGGDRDDHGCLPAAGYAWCETLADCVRAWETPCPPSACGVDLYRDATTGNCSSLTVCNTTELEVVAPTATSDRVCRCHSWAAWTWLDVAWRVAAILFLFCGIAVICDDYFTPALEGIVEAWDLSEDVAGATFMAAGSSAPELFTSLIAVFAPHEPCTADTEGVGVGTIVGSAIFNVLIIIGLSAVLGCAPGQPLKLDWKPLLRDTIFYVLAIVLLVVCLMDGKVWWHEALTMLSLYVCYIVFMRFNERVCYPNGRLAQIQDEENGTVGAAPQDTSEEKAELVAGSETPRSDAEQSVDVNTTEGNTHRHWSHSLSWVYRSPWTLAFKCTVPDPEERYMAGFFSSIMWIAVLCYFMVEWSVDVAQMVQVRADIFNMLCRFRSSDLLGFRSSFNLRDGSGAADDSSDYGVHGTCGRDLHPGRFGVRDCGKTGEGRHGGVECPR